MQDLPIFLERHTCDQSAPSVKHQVCSGDAFGAISAMLAPIEEGFCSPEEQQELYYQAAYFASLVGDSENMMNYLTTALELAPESEMAAAIRLTIDAYSMANESTGVSAEGME